jgi:hypothetical protein
MRVPTTRYLLDVGAPGALHCPLRRQQPSTSSFRRRPESHFDGEDGCVPGRRSDAIDRKARAIPAFAGMTVGEVDVIPAWRGRRWATWMEAKGGRA